MDGNKHNILGVLVSAVDYDMAIDRIAEAASQRTPLLVTALAVHGLMTGALDKTHRYRLNRFDLVAPDGQPVRWALNSLYGLGLSERVYGPTLMLKVCERAAADDLPVFLFGADAAMLERLRNALQQRFPRLKIAGCRPSRFCQLTPHEKSALLEEIRQSGARITFVGLGCPRQEVFVYECCQELEMPLLAVGAAFAFHAGSVRQAPAWMQRHGWEWFYRFCQEPRRLWRRYLLLNPLYVMLIMLQMARLRCPDEKDALPPSSEQLYG